MANLDFDEEFKLDLFDELEEEDDVDTTFRETSATYKKGSIEEDYYPALFGDDGFEQTKHDLLKRVEKETRCAPIHDVDFYMEKEALSIAKTEKLAKKFEALTYKPTYLRCKIAFKDLSHTKRDPFIIRTRNGK